MNILYVAGLPRTASTLFMNFLGQNPDFAVSPTSPLVELYISLSESYACSNQAKAWVDQRLLKLSFREAQKGLLEGFAKAMIKQNAITLYTTPNWYVDKSRWWTGQIYNLKKTFNDAPKMIIMLRDLRGIAASMEEQHQKHPELTAQADTLWPSVVQRINGWFADTQEPVGSSLSRIRQLINTKHCKDVLFVRFEDFTSNPQETMNQVYKYLETSWYKHNQFSINQITHENDALYLPYGTHTIQNKITLPINNWNKVLPQEVSVELVKNNMWYYKQFYQDKLNHMGVVGLL